MAARTTMKAFLTALVILAVAGSLVFLAVNNHEAVLDGGICKGCNIVLVTVDSLRYDRLGCYGYPKGTSPNTDSICANSVVFDSAISQSTWTKPALASLMTSKYVSEHHVVGRPGDDDEGDLQVLPESETTLAEIFRGRGYSTAAFFANGMIGDGSGFDQGFDVFYSPNVEISWEDAWDENVTDRAVSWLGEREGPGKFLLQIHYISPHADYEPPSGFMKVAGPDAPEGSYNFSGKHQDDLFYANLTGPDLEELSARYDGEVRFLDSQIGRLLEKLNEIGAGNRTIFVITSVSGELLGEQKGKDGARIFGHGHMVPEVVYVPLIVAYPGLQGTLRRGNVAELVDILPTLLSLSAGGNENDRPVFSGANLFRGKESGFSDSVFVPGSRLLGIAEEGKMIAYFCSVLNSEGPETSGFSRASDGTWIRNESLGAPQDFDLRKEMYFSKGELIDGYNFVDC
ncbi:MAG: sulfatase [archaeon]